MAFGNLHFTTNAFRITRRAFPFAGVSSLDGLSTGDPNWSKNDQAAALLTDIERSILSQHPTLGLATSDVLVPAAERTLPLPSGATEASVTNLYLIDTSSPFNQVPIPLISRQEGETRSGYQLNSMQVDAPAFAYLDRTRENIVLQGAMSKASTIRVEYRTGPRTYLASDIDAEDGVNYSAIPDEHIDVIIFRFAAELAGIDGDFEREQRLNAKSMVADDALLDALIEASAQAQRPVMREFGYPGTSLTSQSGRRFQTLNPSNLRS